MNNYMNTEINTYINEQINEHVTQINKYERIRFYLYERERGLGLSFCPRALVVGPFPRALFAHGPFPGALP